MVVRDTPRGDPWEPKENPRPQPAEVHSPGANAGRYTCWGAPGLGSGRERQRVQRCRRGPAGSEARPDPAQKQAWLSTFKPRGFVIRFTISKGDFVRCLEVDSGRPGIRAGPEDRVLRVCCLQAGRNEASNHRQRE